MNKPLKFYKNVLNFQIKRKKTNCKQTDNIPVN